MALIGVLRKTLVVVTVTRTASEWRAPLSLALWVTVRNTLPSSVAPCNPKSP